MRQPVFDIEIGEMQLRPHRVLSPRIAIKTRQTVICAYPHRPRRIFVHTPDFIIRQPIRRQKIAEFGPVKTRQPIVRCYPQRAVTPPVQFADAVARKVGEVSR